MAENTEDSRTDDTENIEDSRTDDREYRGQQNR